MPHKSFTVVNNALLDPNYRVVELPQDLIKTLEEGTERLYLKAGNPDEDVVLCSRARTYKLRQRNHSNTVLVMKTVGVSEVEAGGEEGSVDDLLCGYTKLDSVLECHETEGNIDASRIPLYDGEHTLKEIESGKHFKLISVDELKQESAISEAEFNERWVKLNGSSINGNAVILNDDFITRGLHVILMSLMAENLDLAELSIIECYRLVQDNSDFSMDIVETILRKFAKNKEEPLEFDKVKIAKWYGLETLRKYATKKSGIHISEFLVKWKSSFPPFFECPIDMPLLKGQFVMTSQDKIFYISRDELPSDVQGRLKVLFRHQSSWDLEDLIPFIEEFNVKKVKFENFIMKFAKKRKVGKDIIITQR